MYYGVLWLAVVTTGLILLWQYQSTPGAVGAHAQAWPIDSGLRRAPAPATLVMAVHPRCVCSRASIGELARLMTRVQGRLSARVICIRPPGFPAGWEQTDLWHSAAAIPGVTVIADADGREARRFNLLTSGETLLFDRAGRLIFSGGITAARGHAGDNAGRATVVSLVTRDSAEPQQSLVFDCPLFFEHSHCYRGENECNHQME